MPFCRCCWALHEGFDGSLVRAFTGAGLAPTRGKSKKRFSDAIRPDDIVYHLGAQAGLYSLLASRLIARQGAVYSFEPLTRNVQFLGQRIKLNQVTSINVFELAIGETDGAPQFSDGPNPLQGSPNERGLRTVRVARLDTLFSEGHLRPTKILKIDIEGGELQECLGTKKLLETHRPSVFLAIDAPSDYECCDLLRTLGYRIDEFDINGIIATTES
jgi:FkbM family methyltransferase